MIVLATCGGVAFQRESKSSSFPKQLQIIIASLLNVGFERKKYFIEHNSVENLCVQNDCVDK